MRVKTSGNQDASETPDIRTPTPALPLKGGGGTQAGEIMTDKTDSEHGPVDLEPAIRSALDEKDAGGGGVAADDAERHADVMDPHGQPPVSSA